MIEKRSYKALWILALVVLVGLGFFFFFYRMYQNDMQTLEGFSAAYADYDQAISNISNLDTHPAETVSSQKGDEALALLRSKAAIRISSMIKHEKEVMSAMQEVADISGKELDAFKTYQGALTAKTGETDQMLQVFRGLTSQRKAAYARFLDLGKD